MEEQDYSSYKHSKAMLMEHNNGTTFAETVTVLFPVPLGIVLTSLTLKVLSLHHQLLASKLWAQFLIEFCLVVLPLLFSVTVWSDFSYLLVTLMSSACMILLLSSVGVAWKAGSVALSIPIKDAKRPYITNFRSSINLTTCLCILAVDFSIFPRRFAKSESFGFSLMDTGVGGYIFANAIVSREALGARRHAPSSAVWKATVSSLPLIVLGVARLLSTRSLDYYVNVTEYGLHWNFFFTLAVCKVSSTVLLCVFHADYSAFLSVFVMCLHEFLLASGVQDWVLGPAPRGDFLSANREGIISCSGYVALYLAGVCVGRLLHSKRTFLRDYLHLAAELLCAMLLFSALGIFWQRHLGASRRLANFGYFFLTVAYNLTFLTVFLFTELVTMIFEHKTNQKHINSKPGENKLLTQVVFVPTILDSFNYNGLLSFLIANLFTGCVNLYIRTIQEPVFGGAVILILYSFLLCSIVVLFSKYFHFKVW